MMKSEVVTTIKLSHATANRVARLAKKQGRSRSDVIREILEKGLDTKTESLLHLTHDLAGVWEGTKDLATNPKHMRGFGKK